MILFFVFKNPFRGVIGISHILALLVYFGLSCFVNFFRFLCSYFRIAFVLLRNKFFTFSRALSICCCEEFSKSFIKLFNVFDSASISVSSMAFTNLFSLAPPNIIAIKADNLLIAIKLNETPTDNIKETDRFYHKGNKRHEYREARKPWIKCANCKGPHVPSYRGCLEYKKQAFRQHVVNEQKTYASVVNQNTLPQPKTETVIFTADQLVKFVANVVIHVA